MSGQSRLLARMAREGPRRVYAPEQTGLSGPRAIPSRSFCIQSGEEGYCSLMESRWDRARQISCALIGPHNIPVTPLVNPRTGHSFHIIHVTSDWRATHAVDLLVRDADSYILSFRRQLLGGDGNWSSGIWYIYSDVNIAELPKDIKDNLVSLEFDSAHADSSRTTPGGLLVMHNMFEVLSRFEDCRRDRKGNLLDGKDNTRAEEALLKAIVIFSEAFRFRSIYLSVRARIRDDESSSQVDPSHWHILHNWGNCSQELLTVWCQGPLPGLDSASPAYFAGIRVRRPDSNELRNLSTLGDVIGPSGEIMLVKAFPNLIVRSLEEMDCLEKLAMRRNAVPVAEPGFRDVPLPNPEAQ